MALPATKLFTLPDAWNGGSYELALMLGPRDDARLRAALHAVWSFAELDGCYELADVEPVDQPRRAPVEAGRELETPLRGRARLPTGVVVPCSTLPVREEGGADWLYFGLPMGSLGRAYAVGAFPWDDGTNLAWRKELDSWLCALAAHVLAKQPFRMAMVGFTDGEQEPDRVLQDGIPERRWLGYIVPDADSIRWYPPTEGAPIGSARASL